jgi:hypothetical protein
MMIKVAKDFSYAPGPRFIREGANSGELFRTAILRDAVREAIERNEELVIDLDGTAGVGPSFIDESFGGLIRADKFDYDALIKIIKVISKEQPKLEDKVQKCLEKARQGEQ